MSVVGDPVLLVPMHIDALAAGKKGKWPDRNLFQWTRLSPHYAKLDNTETFYLGPETDFAEEPFQEADALDPGVHLHFHLPRAFVHGHQAGVEALSFPRIPNRWLVQRFGSTPGSHRAWLVASDLPAGEDGLAWPVFPATETDRLVVRKIGQKTELTTELQAEDAPSEVSLTAVGPGDALFSAHYQASGRILGFHDTLEGISNDTRLSYLVTGWFSAACQDPLWLEAKAEKECARGQNWTDLTAWLEAQGWTCEAGPTAPLPERLVCHGLVRGLKWRGEDWNYSAPELFPSDPSDVAHHHDVALAETPAEAVAALLVDGPVEQDLLSALQADLLGQQVTVEGLLSELHCRRFNSAATDTVFVLLPEPNPVAAGMDASTNDFAPSPVALDLASDLEALNAAQERCDAADRHLEACGRELHALWHLSTTAWNDGKDEELITRLNGQVATFRTVYDAATDAFLDASATRDKIYADRTDAPTGTLADRLAKEATSHTGPDTPPRYRLVRSPARVFQIANEPAIAVAGPAAGRHNTAERAKTIACRLDKQIITGVSLKVPGESTMATITSRHLTETMLGPLPKTLDALHGALLAEALLTDPAYASHIADGVRAEYRKRLTDAVETLLRETANESTDGLVKLAGMRPDPIAVFDREVGNPWNPLVLDWKVTWTPNAATAGDGTIAPDIVRERWRLATGGDLAPVPDGNGEPIAPKPGLPHATSGRSFLLSSEARALRERLEKLNDSHELLGQLRTRPIAAQGLAGFNAALVMRRLATVLPAFDFERFNEDGSLYPDPMHAVMAAGNQALRFVPVEGPFLPIREGTLTVSALNIVDSFGQTLKLLRPASEAQPMLKIAASCRATSEHGEIMRLPPRLTYPTRLRFDWGEGTKGGAIAGWMVPNRLDFSLTVHAADGRALGMLQKKLGQRAGTPDRHAFSWVGVPDVPGSVAAEERPDEELPERLRKVIDDRDLLHFCQWVLQLDPDSGAVFFALLGEQVDASDQRVPEAEAALSLLVGRPLALARATLRLEAAGFPIHRPTLNTAAEGASVEELLDTRGVERVAWPIRLGSSRARDDALVGFFRCGSEGAIGALNPAWGRVPGAPAADFPSQDLFIDGTEPLPLVLLLDPQARVHVTSGVLPVATFVMPPEALSGRQGVREAFFQTAPVLGFSEAPEMPRPADDYGAWSWAWRPQVGSWRSAPELVEAAERGGFTDRWPSLSEGWLKLFVEPQFIASFWVLETAEAVPSGSRIRLGWAVQRAEQLDLFRLEESRETLLSTWETPPFPSAFAVVVDRDTTFRLKATGSGKEENRYLTVHIQGPENRDDQS